MTTITTARKAMRDRLAAGGVTDRNNAAVPLRWQNENADATGSDFLPGEPSPFIFSEFIVASGPLVSFGGGAGQNRFRNQAHFVAYVFVPKNDGLDQAEDIAEQVAVLFRSYRTGDVSCFEATVYPGGDGNQLKPQGFNSAVGDYFWCSCEVSLFFDQIG